MKPAARAIVETLERCLQRYPDPMLLVGRDHRILVQNLAAGEVLGDNRGTACEAALARFLATEGSLPLAEVLERGRTHRGHLRLRPETSEESFFEITALPLDDEDGAIFAAVVLFRDVTISLRYEHQLFEQSQDLERSIEEKTGQLESLRDRGEALRRELDELRESQAQVLQKDRIMTLGQLVAGVAHDIHTPLGALLSNADLFRRAFDPIAASVRERSAEDPSHAALRKRLDTLEQSAGIIVEAARRIEKVVRRLRDFSRTDEAHEQLADLHECLDSALALVGHQAGDKVQLVRRYGEIPRILCQPDALNQAFLNLIVNGIQAIEDRGTLEVTTRHAGDAIEVSIRDSGRGIPADVLSRVFDPGFTTKGRGVGTGLGLAICRRIFADHDGDISIDSTPGQGTKVTVTLPCQPPRKRGSR